MTNVYKKMDNLAIDTIVNILSEIKNEIDFNEIESKYNGSLQDYINDNMLDIYEDIIDDYQYNNELTDSEMHEVISEFTPEEINDTLYVFGLENEYDFNDIYENPEIFAINELYNPLNDSEIWNEAYYRLVNN